jgi:hypothetical protein
MVKNNDSKPSSRPKPTITTSKPQNVVLHNLTTSKVQIKTTGKGGEKSTGRKS